MVSLPLEQDLPRLMQHLQAKQHRCDVIVDVDDPENVSQVIPVLLFHAYSFAGRVSQALWFRAGLWMSSSPSRRRAVCYLVSQMDLPSGMNQSSD